MAAWKHTICICAKRNENLFQQYTHKSLQQKKTVLNNFASKRATNHSAKTISIQGETNKPGIIILADSLKRRRENKRS